MRTCEEYVLAELTRLQLEAEGKDERIAELEYENGQLHARLGKMEPEVFRLSEEVNSLRKRISVMGYAQITDFYDVDDDPTPRGDEDD